MSNLIFPRLSLPATQSYQIGGANRDRTGDLKLAKLALSQLSYGPDVPPERNKDGQARSGDASAPELRLISRR